MNNIIYEPFETLKEQECFEESLKDEIEQGMIDKAQLSADEDMILIENARDKVSVLQSRLEERLIYSK
ncbi:MAG: hypothetical protein Q8936_17165 [Bacillota bacterium]|nr:hypothetical protein [Bacillota bacterium]